jgi:hypothetical protein
MEFFQKSGFASRKYQLLDDKIIVETKNINESLKYEVRYEEIGTEVFYKSENRIVQKIFAFVCLLLPSVFTISYLLKRFNNLGVVIVFWIISIVLASLFFFKKGEDNIILSGGTKVLVFFRTKPNEKEVLSFIEKIFNKRKSFLLQKYLYDVKFHSGEEYLERLAWFRDRNIITDFEHNDFIEDFKIKNLFN